MARGFESKDVEFQQEEAGRQRARGPQPNAQELADRARLDTLRLALANARDELAAAKHDAHRQMLQRKIDTLVAALGEDSAQSRS